MNKKIIASSIVITAGILLYGVFFRAGNTGEFISAYGVYDSVSDAHVASAHVPGGGNNAARQKLNEILPRVLTADIPPEERRQLSESALVSVGELRREIGAIGTDGKKTETALENLRAASKNVGGFFTRRKAGDIVVLAEERSRIIQDVEKISYGINDKIESIFQGIITDKGALTPERISALNQDLPEAEKQFDRLTENYRKLDEIEKKIDAMFQGLSTERR